MKKPDYRAVGEISSKEVKQSHERALKNLEKAKEIEKDRLNKGWKYHFIDHKTQVLKKPEN